MIYTFYSFKGGVGRSMAMAGVAYLLARRGLKVLAIDFDLEAPGLERYFFDGERCRRVRAEPGLMDLILDYRAALASEAAFEKGEFRNWKQYCTHAIHAAGRTSGSVDLMTAGRREPETALRDYALAVRSFDWQNFFYNAKGDLFFDWLRRRILDPTEGYDVILVDSRTGVTEMGGVCAYQLADVAVLLCAPNFQNLEGTRDVARDFRSESVRALRLGRPLDIVAVPSRIESEHPGRAEFLARFADELGVDGLPIALARAGLDYEQLAIPYVPAFAVAERIAGDAASDPDVSGAPVDIFGLLTDALTLLAQDGTRLSELKEAALARLTGAEVEKTHSVLADTTRSSAGYDAFIDFSADDLRIASELSDTLERSGYRTYLDLRGQGSDPSQNSVIDKSSAVDHAIEYSEVLLVAFGKPTRNEWRAQLIARARRLRGIRIVPLLLPGSDFNALHSFGLSEYQALDLRDWPRPEARERLLSAFSSFAGAPQSIAGEPVHAEVDSLPYVGERAYGEDDAAFFFGRDEDIHAIQSLLRTHSVVCITGPAKVGKTSLVRAGVVPLLRQSGQDGGAQRFRDIAYIDLSTSVSSKRAIKAATHADLLIIDAVDTFESGGRRQEIEGRLKALVRLVASTSSDCRLILVARDVLTHSLGDMASRVIRLAAMRRNIAHHHVLPMSREALQRAIEGPAERAGHLLEPGLTDRLIEGAGNAMNGIAQIQLALFDIWQGRKRGWLTNKSLDATGQLDGMAAARYRRLLASLDHDARQAAHAFMLRLVTLSGRRELVPAPQPWKLLATVPLIASVDSVRLRDRLAAEMLIDVYRERSPHGVPGEADGALVALARASATLFFEDSGAEIDLKYLLWRDALKPQLRLWQDGAHDALLHGAPLIEAEQWLGSHPQLLTGRERDFLNESLADRERRRADKRAQLEKEQLQRELTERERLYAAELLAAESTKRAKLERVAKQSAVEEAQRLRIRSAALIGLLALSVGLMLISIVAWRKNQKLLEESEDARVQAIAYEKSLRIAIENLDEAARARTRVVEAASELDAAALSTLRAADGAERRSAIDRLDKTRNDFVEATESISKLDERCPVGRRLYLHIAQEDDRAKANALIPHLEAKEFIVPGIELVRFTGKDSEIRYFRERDREDAAEATNVLRNQGLALREEQHVAVSASSLDITPCRYEAWFAAGIPATPITLPITLRYYRDSDRKLVESVAEQHAFRVERRQSRLVGIAPNILMFSHDIPVAERTQIALAFVDSGFVLLQMSDAQKVTDRRLVQVVASLPAQQRCGRLDAAQIRAGATCGRK